MSRNRRPASWEPRRVIAESLVPNLSSAVERYQATVSARRLARAAVELRRRGLAEGGYPADLAPLGELAAASPYTNEPMRYEFDRDGGARLSYPRARALWDENNPAPASTLPPLLDWTLPPPS